MKKMSLIIFTLFLGLSVIFISEPVIKYFITTANLSPESSHQTIQKKTVWMNIFIHGSFGSLLGIVSLPNVLKDEVHGTTYRGLNRDMRDDVFFFRSQPILQRGLIAITPSFSLPEQENERYAAFPITKAFDEIAKNTLHGDFDQLYYTFGWSGLISQHRRRLEAIRLYNALQEEISRLNTLGIDPKIRILTHSHGGNICLNLGAIVPVMQTKTFSDHHRYSLDPTTNESIKKMLTIIKSLPPREQAAFAKGQKKYDYVPNVKTLLIEELVLLGTPIQPETELFLTSPIFKRVYNIYSDADFVQKMDWISTKEAKSYQRINIKKFGSITEDKIIQAKIMYEHSLTKTGDYSSVAAAESEKGNIIDTLLGTKAITKDPDHRKLWFLGSEKNIKDGTESFLFPLPTIIFVPAIQALIKKSHGLHDVDINFTLTNNQVHIALTEHGQPKILHNLFFHKALLKEIQEKVAPWVPQKTTAHKEFETIYKHITNNQNISKQAPGAVSKKV